MALTPGTRLGPYEVSTQIGVGGMGEVYKATDTNLKRSVAIKVLPASVAGDAERLARFQREAEVLASLNHPSIAAIYGLERSGSTTALVMELVEGPTLADRIAQGAIPIDEALPIAKQIAEALEAAHEQGIIHRDLKPANIKVRADGTVKVLDFGLAKAMEPTGAMSANASMSPTITSPAMMTGAGMILGTAAYMSPEQARGKTVDKRSDIWAFGAVLFEMVTGRTAFTGETVSDTIVSVLSRDIDWNALPLTLPSTIRDLLRRCLQRDSTQRLRDIGDARIEIAEALTAGSAPRPTEISVSTKRRPAILTLAALGLAVLMGAVIGRTLLTRSQETVPSWTGTLLGGPNVAWRPRISPDGKTLAFLAMVDGLAQVAVMNPESGNWTVLTKHRTNGYVSTISWSRDGTRIYYNRFAGLPLGIYSVPALGGEERLILENASGAEPLPDGSLLVARINARRETQIYRYWPRDGRLDPLPGILTGSENVPLQVLPDGSHAVFIGRPLDQESSDSRGYLNLMDLATGTVTRFATDIDWGPTPGMFGVMPDGQSVVLSFPYGDLHRVVAIPIRASGRTQTLIDVQPSAAGAAVDVGPDGSLYVGQGSRPVEVFRFSTSGAGLERINTFPNATCCQPILHLPDASTLMTATVGGRNRLLLGVPGKDTVPFVDTDEETSTPAALLGNDRVSFLIGKGTERRIAIASVKDRRILGRLQSVKAATITAMAASPDGSTVYFVDSGTVWSVATRDEQPRKIHSGDGVAITPDGKDLIIKLVETETVRWIKVSVDNGTEQPIAVKGEVRFTPNVPGSGTVGRDGRLVVPIAVSDSWFYPPAIFDPNTGSVQRIPVPDTADYFFPAWTSDGKIIVDAHSLVSSIWRFRLDP